MMERVTRQEAKARGLSTCYGSACAKHPNLEGLRRVSGACVECAKETLRRNRQKNPERTKAQYKKDAAKLKTNTVWIQQKRKIDVLYRKANKEQCRAIIVAWSARNPDKVKQYAKKTKIANKGKVNALTVKRRLAKINRTPIWLTVDDHWMIEQAYELATLRTKMFGFQWHVDHIIPLQGKTVSGLHVPLNLQVIPGIENIRKGNRIC